MQYDIGHFFRQYADAYADYRLETFKTLFSLPCLLLADEKKSLISDETELQQHLQSQFDAYQWLGVAEFRFRVQNQVRLSASMVFVSLYWHFVDSNQQVIFTCHTSYTLRTTDDNWQIVAIVTDDETAAYQRVLRDKGQL